MERKYLMSVYLDFNASTPIDPRVLGEMVTVYKDCFGNADSRTHLFGQRAKKVVEEARTKIATLLEVEKNEIIFTSGATESNNIAILGLARWGGENGRKHIVSTKIEHKAVLEPLKYLAKNGFEITLVDVDKSGRVKACDVLNQVRPDTLLVSIMHANNETGIIQPVENIGEELVKTDTYFHIDAAQTFGKLVDELKNTKYDMLSISGHKIYGPQGIGVLVLKKRSYKRPPIMPITFGGGQEVGIRPGTLPVALIAGLGKSAEIAASEYDKWYKRNKIIKKSIIKQLSNVNHIINGDQNYCMFHTLNVSFLGVDSEALMLSVKNSCAISNGSACTSHDYKPSHVLTAMDLSDDTIESAVRLSWGPHIDNVDISKIVEMIKRMT
jgi:cysteine desulfurase